jgi:phenylacetate-CoA ligase
MKFYERLFWTAYLVYHLRGQAQFPFRPREDILNAQARRLRRIMRHAYRNVPYYKETLDRLGLKPEDFKTANDLARLPVLERQDLQNDPERFIAHGVRLDRSLVLSSSGSTGVPISVVHDRKDALQTAAHTERYRSVIGAALKGKQYRETIITFPASTNSRHRRFWLQSTVVMRRLIPRKQILSLCDPPEKNIPLIRDFNPDVIHGYGSYIGELFSRLSSESLPFPRLKAVGYAGDGLSEAARSLILNGFGIPVFGSYHSIEAQRIGFECPEHTGLHVNEDIYPVRIIGLDGRESYPEESGDVIISNLVNRAMVLLNYRLGDTAAFRSEPCPCGRFLPLISYPSGRSNDWLVLPDGTRIHGETGLLPLVDENLLQYQIIQLSPDRFRIFLVAGRGVDLTAMERRISDNFRKAFGAEVRTEILFVRSIPRTEGGKIRPVIPLAANEGDIHRIP